MSRPKAYSYIRMSTDIQIRGDSKRRQEELSSRYAAEHDLDLQTDFKLSDIGVSAYTGDNIKSGALGKFIAAIQNQEIEEGSYLLIESFDRLSRAKIQTALKLFLEILEYGIRIVTLSDGQSYSKENLDTQNLLISIFIMSRAHEESKIKSQRLTASWENKRRNITEKKLTAKAPAWLKLSADRKQFIPIPERVRAVEKIFNDCANGIGIYSTMRKLNVLKAPTFGRSDGWHKSTVNKILNSRAVLGEYQPHKMSGGKRVPFGDPIQGYFPQIIDKELFVRAQSARQSRITNGAGRKGAGFTNLFSGLAVCGYCHSKMTYRNRGSGPKGGTYLVCGQTDRGLDCKSGAWRYKDFEKSFFSFIREVDVRSLAKEKQDTSELRQLETKLQFLTGTIKDLQAQHQRLVDFVALGETNPDMILPRIKQIETQITETEQDRVRTQETHDRLVLDLASLNTDDDIVAILDAINSDQENSFENRSLLNVRIRSIVKELVVFPRGTTTTLTRSFEIDMDEEGNVIGQPRKTEYQGQPEYSGNPYFAVILTNGTMRVVSPKVDKPSDAEILGEISGLA